MHFPGPPQIKCKTLEFVENAPKVLGGQMPRLGCVLTMRILIVVQSTLSSSLTSH